MEDNEAIAYLEQMSADRRNYEAQNQAIGHIHKLVNHAKGAKARLDSLQGSVKDLESKIQTLDENHKSLLNRTRKEREQLAADTAEERKNLLSQVAEARREKEGAEAELRKAIDEKTKTIQELDREIADKKLEKLKVEEDFKRFKKEHGL